MTDHNGGGPAGGQAWPSAGPQQQANPVTPDVPVQPPVGAPELAPWAVASAEAPVPGVEPTSSPYGRGRGGGRWIAVTAAVVCLVLAGVAIAWFLTGDPGTDDAAASSTVGAPPSKSADTADGEPGNSASSSAPEATAPSGPLQPRSVTATCQAEDGVDSAGTTTTYDPEHVLDGRTETAWRCAGSAVGARLVLEFDGPVTVTSVGLVPGYAKMDPSDGSNRFTQNRTITSVTWRFDDATTHVQEIPAPQPFPTDSRLMAAVSTTRVVLEISGTGNDTAMRDFTAISDVQISGY